MDLSKAVKLLEKLNGISERLLRGDELGGNSFFEADSNIGRLVGGVLGVVGHSPHVIWRGLIRVLQNASFVAAMGEISIH